MSGTVEMRSRPRPKVPYAGQPVLARAEWGASGFAAGYVIPSKKAPAALPPVVVVCPPASRAGDPPAPLPPAPLPLTPSEWFREIWLQLESPARQLMVRQIQAVVVKYYDLPSLAMEVGRRTRCWIRPRQLAMWLCKEITSKSLPSIGRDFGGADHTTVLHACRRIEFHCARDPAFAAVVADLRGRLEAMI